MHVHVCVCVFVRLCAANQLSESAMVFFSRAGVSYFEYEWSEEYQHTQEIFNACAAGGDPNAFMMLLESHPFHVDTMLQLSEYFRATGQLEEAADMLKR